MPIDRYPALRMIIRFAMLLLSNSLTATRAHEVAIGYAVKPIALPKVTGPVSLDHLAYDRADGTLWVPAGNTGNVYVIKKDSAVISVINGFNTGGVEIEGKKAKLGPTAVALTKNVVGSSRVDLQACKLEYSIVSPK